MVETPGNEVVEREGRRDLLMEKMWETFQKQLERSGQSEGSVTNGGVDKVEFKSKPSSIKTFVKNGEVLPQDFWNDMSCHAADYDPRDWIRFLRSTLGVEERKWLYDMLRTNGYSITKCNPSAWEHIYEEFMSEMAGSESKRMDAFINVKMRRNESMSSYLGRVASLAAQAGLPQHSVRIGRALAGMSREVRAQVAVLGTSKTYKEFSKKVVAVMDLCPGPSSILKKDRSELLANVNGVDELGEVSWAEGRETTAGVADNAQGWGHQPMYYPGYGQGYSQYVAAVQQVEPVQSVPNNAGHGTAVGTVSCTRCGGNHAWDFCNEIQCWNCMEWGHMSRSCPRTRVNPRGGRGQGRGGGPNGGRGWQPRAGTCLICGPGTHSTNACDLARQAIEAGRSRAPGNNPPATGTQVNAVEEVEGDTDF